MTPAVPTSTAAMQNSDGVSTPFALTSSGASALSPTWKVGLLRTLSGDLFREFCSCLHTGSQGPLYWVRWWERAAEGETQHPLTEVPAVYAPLASFLLGEATEQKTFPLRLEEELPCVC